MLKLNKPLAGNSNADARDVQIVKHALNRLGLYTPYEKTGITEYPDEQMFLAIKDFQREHKLPVTGVMKPDDKTSEALNTALASAPDGQYIWHSVKDEHVRASHAALDGTKRKWSETPYPGQDYNCRCWAGSTAVPDLEARSLSEKEFSASENVKMKLEGFKILSYDLSATLLEYYLANRRGEATIGEDYFNNESVIVSAIEENRKRFEDDFMGIQKKSGVSFKQKILEMKNGEKLELSDYWDKDWDKWELNPFSDFFNSIGSIKIRSQGDFTVIRHKNIVLIQGMVVHSFNDVYDFNDDKKADQDLFENERYLAERKLAKPFDVHWEKAQNLSGTMVIENGDIKTTDFRWSE